MCLHQIIYSASYIFNRCKCKEAADQHIIANHRLRFSITKQTFNKNLGHVMNELTDENFLGSKITKALVT